MMRKKNSTGFIKKNIFVAVIALLNVIKADEILGYDNMKAGISEYILMFNGGVGISMSHVPVLLIAFIMYISVVAVSDCYNGPGYADIAEIVRLGRRNWWVKRYLRCIGDMVTYILTMAVIFICAAHGKWSTGEAAGKAIVKYFDSNIEYIYPGTQQFIVSGIIVPVFMIMSIILAVKALAIAAGPLIPVICLCMLTVVSIWSCNSLIPGSYIMLMKSELYIGSIGTGAVWGILYAIFILIAAFAVGCVLIRKKDIVPSRK